MQIMLLASSGIDTFSACRSTGGRGWEAIDKILVTFPLQ